MSLPKINDKPSSRKYETVLMLIGFAPIALFLIWIVLANCVSIPNEGKYRLLKTRVKALSRAIVEFKRQQRKDPEKVEELASYFLKLQSDPSAKPSDALSNYFRFSISKADGEIGDREPKGKPLQAGFGQLHQRLVIIGIGPTNQPIVFSGTNRNYLLKDENF